MSLYKCPCCNLETLKEKPTGTFQICPICDWEDDNVQFFDKNFRGGANECSLNECKEKIVNLNIKVIKNEKTTTFLIENKKIVLDNISGISKEFE